MNNKFEEIAKRFKDAEEDLSGLKPDDRVKTRKLEDDLETKPAQTDSDDGTRRTEEIEEQLAELKGQVADLKQVIEESNQTKGVMLWEMVRSLPVSLPLIISLTTVLLVMAPVPLPVPFSALLLVLLGSLQTCDIFADDTCIHVSDACYGNVLSTIQLSANEVFNWATNNCMTIHPQKTKYMIITTWQKHQRIPLSNVSITINKEPIERVSHIKFLGVIVDNNLSWAYHIKEITSKMAKYTYQLARIKNVIDERCRKTFYHAYIHNKLEYGILLFGGAAAHQLRPLKPLQKRAVKLVVKIVLLTSSKRHVFFFLSI